MLILIFEKSQTNTLLIEALNYSSQVINPQHEVSSLVRQVTGSMSRILLIYSDLSIIQSNFWPSFHFKRLAHRAPVLTFRCILPAQDSFGRPLSRPTGCPVNHEGRSRKLAVMNGQWRPMGKTRGPLPPQWKRSDVPARPSLGRGARKVGQALPDVCGRGVLVRKSGQTFWPLHIKKSALSPGLHLFLEQLCQQFN